MASQLFDNSSEGDRIGSRYEVQRQLGKKTGRQTLLARDIHTQELVVLKLLSFGGDFAWDDLKLFEREAKTLQALSHPAIPRYLDYFEFDSPSQKGFALVQSFIAANSLEEHLKAGRTFSEAEVKQLAKALLEILIYLHGRQPPVIHRDIKPSNILLTNRSGHHVGDVYLVDFGSVQTLTAREGGTMTVVGTYGYMPPEQFGGRTVPASDLYSLGATLIYLGTGTHPADLPQKELRIQFEPAANFSSALAHWLRQMTEPSLDLRFTDADEALQAIERLPQKDAMTLVKNKPAGSKIQITKDVNFLEILVPPIGFNPGIIFLSFFAIAWNSFLFPWTGFALLGPFPANLFFVLFSLPFWAAGIWMVLGVLFCLFGRIRLRLNQKQIALTWELFGFKYQRPRPAPRRDIHQLSYICKHFTKDSDGDRIEVPTQLVIRAGTQEFKLGGKGGAIENESEIEWLAQELSEWLGIPITRV